MINLQKCYSTCALCLFIHFCLLIPHVVFILLCLSYFLFCCCCDCVIAQQCIIVIVQCACTPALHTQVRRIFPLLLPKLYLVTTSISIFSLVNIYYLLLLLSIILLIILISISSYLIYYDVVTLLLIHSL